MGRNHNNIEKTRLSMNSICIFCFAARARKFFNIFHEIKNYGRITLIMHARPARSLRCLFRRCLFANKFRIKPPRAHTPPLWASVAGVKTKIVCVPLKIPKYHLKAGAECERKIRRTPTKLCAWHWRKAHTHTTARTGCPQWGGCKRAKQSPRRHKWEWRGKWKILRRTTVTFIQMATFVCT